jgi:alpha/beta superfamily hydrolase
MIALHPLPTHGGMMDSHIFRKAAWRLPALANIAVLRFNTRGTESAGGKSEGEFANATTEQFDVEAAVQFAIDAGLPQIWIVGWSFGTDLALKFGLLAGIEGVILLSPPLRFSTPDDLLRWDRDGRPVVALIPELDDYLRPAAATQAFAPLSHVELIPVEGAKHLWVGEPAVHRVLSEITKIIAPERLPLPTEI